MTTPINRREFLAKSAATAAGTAGILTTAAESEAAMQAKGPLKAVNWYQLPDKLSVEDRFLLAKNVGFQGVEIPPVGEADADRLRAAAEKAGIRIHSIIYGGWGAPFSSGDPKVIAQGMKETENALRCAKRVGADNILLVPAVVNAETRYVDAYKRSQTHIRKLIPLAKELGVLILIEEVWNNFLLSPLEFCRYVDEFRSPWVQAYFDIGNVTPFAWPEDWILTLGKRIRKIHLKDFKGGPGLFGAIKGDFVNLRDGSINWPAVRKALTEIGYEGYITTEVAGGDEKFLRDLVGRFDKILAGV